MADMTITGFHGNTDVDRFIKHHLLLLSLLLFNSDAIRAGWMVEWTDVNEIDTCSIRLWQLS